MNKSLENFSVAIIGAGPAGLYAAQELARHGVHATLFNRDIKPGGLAEYGIYPDKLKMKEGLRAQFEKILALPQVEYYGNVSVGAGGVTISDLLAIGFDAVLVAVGAQGTKWLGLPGEDLRGVYHAKDLVYHYNQLPPFSTGRFEIGKRVVVVGVGNVMMDMAHWLARALKVETMTAVARRGPAEVKFDKKEFEIVGANVDVPALDAEIARCAPFMQAIGQDPAAARANILAGLTRAAPPVSDTRILFHFLASPRAILSDGDGHTAALEVEDNRLEMLDGQIRAVGTEQFTQIPCDTVIFAIGDLVDPRLGLPVARGEFARDPNPRFPIDGISYEAFDPESKEPINGVFLAGWARQASTGLVGAARKDAANGERAVVAFLQTLPAPHGVDRQALRERFAMDGDGVVTTADLARLSAAEKAQARARGQDEFKFGTNQEMLDALAKNK